MILAATQQSVVKRCDKCIDRSWHGGMHKIDFNNRLNSKGKKQSKCLGHERKMVEKNPTDAFIGVDTMGPRMNATGSGDVTGTAATDARDQNCTETTSNESKFQFN